MELNGSCHCEKVKFKVLSHAPAPFMHCYCSICRKCQGGGGYAINIMGEYETLEILQGKEYLKGYQGYRDKATKELCGNIRYFCSECGSHLYAYNKQWEKWCYPYASAIDTDLPELKPSDNHQIMQKYKANWAQLSNDEHVFDQYSTECSSLAEWHKKNGHYIE